MNISQTMQKQEQIYYQIETTRAGVIEYDNITAKYMIEQIMVDIHLEAYEHPRIRQEIKRARATNAAPKTRDGIRVFMQQMYEIIGNTTQVKENSHYTGEDNVQQKVEMCFSFFIRAGGCHRGDQCRYSHNPKDRSQCRYGKQCG